ncbi:MAG: polysaccharide biosynthesis/export family protein [Chitinispirillaceae bacterium]|nr:polysaccharide biosynthesis/export family protein [Chitinispirillaceae bacterium]
MKRTALKKAPMLLRTLAVVIALTYSAALGEGEEYILQAGDVISVNVVEHPEFSGKHKIRPDGRINYPVIGELDVASTTCAQLVKIMQGKLAPYINNPVVSVSIESYYANKIFVIGDVTRAGEYEIYEPVDLIKAVAMCGGLKNAKAKQAKIIRGDGSVISVNLRDLLSGVMSKRESAKYLLYPGDTLYVPESMLINWGLIASILGIISITLQIAINWTRLNG